MEIQEDVVLAPYTTFGIGGPADYFTVAHSQEEIIQAVVFAKEKGLKLFVLGTGANILVGDKGYRGLVIKNEANKTVLESNILTAESGATIADVIAYTAQKGLSGFEHFAGIPSSVGGALWQNLHFLSPDRSRTVFIGDMVEGAKILKSPVVTSSGVERSISGEEISPRTSFGRNDMEVVDVNKDYFAFSYDYSILHDTKDIVLSATFALTPEEPKVLEERIGANLLWRKEKHPENAVNCSAGSVFKKIEGHGAGRLIEQVGLKGNKIGGAKISEKHANFIVNEGNATAKDVKELITLVQTTVKQQLGLDMQTEISFVGEF